MQHILVQQKYNGIPGVFRLFMNHGPGVAFINIEKLIYMSLRS
jgi:hypothetical protein